MQINTCRFCHETIWPSQPSLRYGTRHCAHPHCYFDAGKPLSALKKHQVERLPWRVLKDRGLLDEARKMIEGQ